MSLKETSQIYTQYVCPDVASSMHSEKREQNKKQKRETASGTKQNKKEKAALEKMKEKTRQEKSVP